MKVKTILYILYVSLTTVMILSIIEYLLPSDANNNLEDQNFGDVYRIIDPHLGWAHSDKETRVQDLHKRGYSWLPGFTIYNKCFSHLSRPIILTLGGSTTDGVKYAHSWPEELAKIFVTHGQQGSIINGGVGGYSSNQELLKLIRDGLIFNPDIVISYSGVNDGDVIEKRSNDELIVHPMVNKQQLAMLKYVTRQPYILPNIRSWLNRLRYGKNETFGYTLGLDNNSTRSANFEKNMLIMDAASRAQGAVFFGIIQPNAYFNSSHGRGAAPEGVSTFLRFYSEIITLPAKHNFIYDFTGIFDKYDDVYLPQSSVHTTQKGDNIIAQNIYELISPQLKTRSREVKSRPVEAAGEACN